MCLSRDGQVFDQDRALLRGVQGARGSHDENVDRWLRYRVRRDHKVVHRCRDGKLIGDTARNDAVDNRQQVLSLRMLSKHGSFEITALCPSAS